MQNKQTILQKIVMISALVLASLSLLYALGFATDMYALSFHADQTSKTFYIEGAELYYGIQPFNKQLLREAFILFLFCIILFLTLTHKRRLYYASNYIASSMYAGFAVYFGAFNLVNVLYTKQLYLQLDFARMKEIVDMLRMRYVESTFMLDCGIILSVLLFIEAAALLVNMILKARLKHSEKREAVLV